MARTPFANADRGAFNTLEGPSLAAQALRTALARVGLEVPKMEDLVNRVALTQGFAGANVACHIALALGLPDRTAGLAVDRQCAGGPCAGGSRRGA